MLLLLIINNLLTLLNIILRFIKCIYNLVTWTGADVDIRDARDYWEPGKEGVHKDIIIQRGIITLFLG